MSRLTPEVRTEAGIALLDYLRNEVGLVVEADWCWKKVAAIEAEAAQMGASAALKLVGQAKEAQAVYRTQERLDRPGNRANLDVPK